MGSRIQVRSKSWVARTLRNFSMIGTLIFLLLSLLLVFRDSFENILGQELYSALESVHRIILVPLAFSALTLFLFFMIFSKFIKRYEFDPWVPEAAQSVLYASVLVYEDEFMHIEAEEPMERYQIQEFMTEINDQSEEFRYILAQVSKDKMYLAVGVSPLQKSDDLQVVK